MQNFKGAEIIIEYLLKEQVPYLFGVCGHGIIGLLDVAYDRRDRIRTITTHDEQVAGFMADAYYRVSHRPVATYTSCGPGSLNLTMPVASVAPAARLFRDRFPFPRTALPGHAP